VKILSIILFFFCLYGPRLAIADTLLLFNVLTFIALIVRSAYVRSISLHFGFVFGYLFFWFAFYAISLELYYPYQDPEVALTFVRILIFASSSYFIIRLFEKTRISFEKLLFLIVLFTSINSVFVVTFFIYPEFSRWASGYLNYKSQLSWLESGHRIFDISLGGGASGSFTFSLAFISGLFLYWKKSFRRYLNVMLPLIFISTSMMGRTGFFLNTISLFCFIVCLIFSSSRARVFLFLIFFILINSIIIYLSLDLRVDVDGNSKYINWLFEGIFGDSENKSYNAILNMWYLPDSMGELFWGTGNLGRTELYPYVNSDVGYIRTIHAFGLFGLVVIYLIPAVFLLRVSRNNSDYKYLIYAFVAFMLIMNSKELHVTNRGSIFLIFAIVWGSKYLIKGKNHEA
jgi:hypothetical protein